MSLNDACMSLTHSIAGKLFRIIFSVYFAITALVTLAQLAAEYRDAENRFFAEMQSAGATFGHGIDDAVWNFNREGVNKILRGMLNVPVIVGVQVRNLQGGELAAAGVVPSAPATGESLFSQSITWTFPCVYKDEQGGVHQLGAWTVFSDRTLIVERLRYRIVSIIIASAIKASILLVIFLLVVDRVLGRPLKRLRHELTALNDRPDADGARISLGVGGRNELTLVEETLNATLDRLRRSNQDLRELTAAQERKIGERTLELQAANAELARLSETDALTGLSNRRKLETGLADEWRRHQRSGKPLSAIMLDVDHFKAFNDAYGHRAGDDCLRRVAEVIAAAVRRPGDIAARYGGEEFLILLPETDTAGALAVAEAVRAAVAAMAISHAYSPTDKVVTVSLGVAGAAFDETMRLESPDRLIDLADQALYVAKESGRNRVCSTLSVLTTAGLTTAG